MSTPRSEGGRGYFTIEVEGGCEAVAEAVAEDVLVKEDPSGVWPSVSVA